MTAHSCQPPVDPMPDDPETWTCPCGRVWEKRIEDEPEFYDSWYEPAERCADCERCTWNPGPDCGVEDDPHCPTCGHCGYRHVGERNPSAKATSGNGP